MKLVFATLLIAFAVATIATPQQYIDCGSTGVASGFVLDINPCPTLPCQLKKGTNATISVTGSSTESLTDAKTVIHGIIGGVPLPFPSALPDPCNDPLDGFVGGCPIASGSAFNYTAQLAVLSEYPTISKLVVKWELQDQTGADFFCFEVSASIVA